MKWYLLTRKKIQKLILKIILIQLEIGNKGNLKNKKIKFQIFQLSQNQKIYNTN